MVIEPERPADHAAVRAVVGAAFADEPSVVDLVELIRASPGYLPSLALVARVDDEVAGFVMLSRAELVSDSGSRHPVLTLSPLAVAPALQGRGIGSALVPAGLAAAERLGEQLVVLEGSPRYYPRFGFRDCRPFGIQIHLPDWSAPEAGMVFPLSAYDGRARGWVVYPPAFAVVGAG
ncbi:MAG TPA: N-acetyltransferase [Jatrophihabitans sp.]|jgi:putative acetyltransferase|uniref:GNAT family N-acetyltransferase n=1 Tax=Jatrophihabitans sp. TaxID=1932789 RepID=UPI002EE902F0